jgi:tryptophan synthase alpha chain
VSRIAKTFGVLRAQERAAFVAFVTAGDPDAETSFAILEKLPAAGVDVIELGMPFSDPMADGPAIQASSLRALKSGMSVRRTLALAERFRRADKDTPLVLMGYFNPIHAYGGERFIQDAASAGVDGLIVVDLGPEEDLVLRGPANRAGIDIVRLATPTTDDARLKTVLDGASGFLYYVSIAGVTGTKGVVEDQVRRALARIRKQTELPCAVGFGIRTPADAAAIARLADGCVVGSAIVNRIADAVCGGKNRTVLVEETLSFCRALAKAVHEARIEDRSRLTPAR